MKLIKNFGALFILISFFSFASGDSTYSLINKIKCDELKANNATQIEIANQGCCSWHDGICGCVSGKIYCCDMTWSPSCTCNSEDPLETL